MESVEMAEMLERRRVDICGLQEVRLKGEGTRMLRGIETKYKWFWKGSQKRLNGVGIAVKEDLAKAVGVHRVSNRLIELKMLDENMVSFVVVYAP